MAIHKADPVLEFRRLKFNKKRQASIPKRVNGLQSTFNPETCIGQSPLECFKSLPPVCACYYLIKCVRYSFMRSHPGCPCADREGVYVQLLAAV